MFDTLVLVKNNIITVLALKLSGPIVLFIEQYQYDNRSVFNTDMLQEMLAHLFFVHKTTLSQE